MKGIHTQARLIVAIENLDGDALVKVEKVAKKCGLRKTDEANVNFEYYEVTFAGSLEKMVKFRKQIRSLGV